MKNKIRMIGMDLDGTLLKTNKELTAYTKDVLKRAAEQGIIVMPRQEDLFPVFRKS